MHAWRSFAVTLSLALSVVGKAHAHGGRPQTYDVVRDPSDARTLVVPATFGTLITRDDGLTWDSLCIEAMPDPRPGTLRPFVVTEASSILVGQSFGLVRGPMLGCGWAYVRSGPMDPFIIDLVVSGTSTFALRSDAGVANQVFRIAMDGTELTPLAASFALGFLPERLRIAPSDSTRFWVTGTVQREASAARDGRLYVSSDGGATYAMHEVPFTADERTFRVLAVDPRDASRALAVLQSGVVDRLVELEIDAGGALILHDIASLDARAVATERPFGLAMAADGTAYFGNNVEGLMRRDPSGALSVLDAELNIACAVIHGDTLWLCTDGYPDADGDGFALARQDLRVPFAPVPALRYADIRGPVTCGDSSDVVCSAFYRDLLSDWGRLLPDAGVASPDASVSGDAHVATDAGTDLDAAILETPDAAADAPFSFDANPRRDAGAAAAPIGCGCVVGAGATPLGAGWLALAALLLTRCAGRKRASRSPSTPALARAR